jgi:hypothetical protein
LPAELDIVFHDFVEGWIDSGVIFV